MTTHDDLGLDDVDICDTPFYMHRIGLASFGTTPIRLTLGQLTAMCIDGYDMSFRGSGVIISRRRASPVYGPLGVVTILAFCVPCDDPTE